MSDKLNVYGNDRITSRQIDELIGMAKGILADNVINIEEAECLLTWLAANKSICDEPFFRDFYIRISEIISDGIIDKDEMNDLTQLLKGLTGDKIELGEAMKPTTIPFSDPQPDLIFPERLYCFTGTFTFGQRKKCEQCVTERGGMVGNVTRKTDYLVIGSYATESWKHSSMGNKILTAIEYREKGIPIFIVSETHWRKFLTASSAS